MYQNLELYKNTSIKKFLAASLLLVFALSITPAKVLHYFFANHNDSVSIKTQESKSPSLSVAGFNCQIDNLVVESPFTVECQPISFLLPEIINIKRVVSVTTFHWADHFFFELRGPPSLA